MSKDKRDELLEKAIENGWDDGDVMMAYFDACFDESDDLVFMAQNRVILKQHLCIMCGGLVTPGEGMSCKCDSI
jgi:hypothetical protein